MKRYSRTLFPPLDRDYAALSLRPVIISGLVTPVTGGDGGVNISIVEDNPSGVLSAVDPWLRMQVGDRIDLYWDGVTVGSRVIAASDIDQRLFFYMPADPIKPDWAEKVYYSLIRAGSPTAEDCVPLRLRVKLDRPAGRDRDPHLPGHSELAAPQLPQDVIDNGVDAQWAKDGIPVIIAAYPGRAPRDTIELRWGVVSLTRQVTEAEAAGNAPIVITVDQASILAAGDDKNLLVHYQVYDEVWNFSEQWSLQTFVPVDAGGWRLDAPIIQNAVNGEIDLGDLGSANVTVRIAVNASPFERGDTVTMTWLGTTAAGAPLSYSQSVTVESIPAIYDTTVPNAQVRQIINGTAHASYVLTKASGDPPQSSKRAAVRITGRAPLQIPRILELIGDVLDPLQERAHVEIPAYDGMNIGDLIDLIWLGTRANGTPYLYETQHIVSANEVGYPIYIPVMNEHIAQLENGTLDVSYRVSNDAWQILDVRVSEHLLARVGQHVADLPAPIIVEAPHGVLDPEVNPGNVTLRVAYPGTVAGDTLTWYWLGHPLEGSGSDWIPITTAIAGKPVDFTIPRSLIEPNINDEVKVLYTLKHGVSGEYQFSATLNLVIGKIIGELPAPSVVEASGGVLDPMDALSGATVQVSYASMETQDIVTLVWLGSPGGGTPADQEKPGNASGLVEFKMPASVVGANIGREVSVSYRVKRYTAEKPSDVLRLPVLPFGNPDKDLPHPAITQADGQTMTLNLATFTGNATTTVAKWPFILAGQRVWLRIEGETGSGGVYSITLLNGAVLDSAQVSAGLSVPVPRAELEKLGQETRLTVICNVAFDGIASESGAVSFPHVVYAFKLHHEWVKPQIASIKDGTGEVTDGGTTFDTALSISGTSTIETELDILDGTTRLTTVKSNSIGAWSGSLEGLSVKHYSLTASALDGSGLVSQPRRLEVLANVKPIIGQVLDSRGPVSNGGMTVDTSVTISGEASPDRQIELFDNGVSKGIANTNGSGDWSLTVSALAVAAHPFNAKALYGTKPESDVWTVIVAATVAPTITYIKDTQGTEIPPDGFTVDTSVTLTGNASAGLEVEIFDGAVSRQKVNANAGGQWTLTINTLSVTRHDMKVRANYGSNPESAVRKFTVTAVVTPTITSVQDPEGNAVSNGGSTYANAVTASGKASIGQSVEVFDGASSKGTADVNTSGDWSRSVSALSVGTHSLTSKALYGTKPESEVWTVIVAATMAPTITCIKDTQGTEIPLDGFTVYTSVVLTGNASAGLEVEIFDGAVSQKKVKADAGGQWTLTINTLSVGRHDMKVRANYGSNPESAVRKFTVTAVVTPTITSVKDPQGNAVSNGGSTYANAVTASGKASIGQSVEVFDGASSKGTADVNASGDWSRSVSGLSVGTHSLTSKALYGTKPESDVWTVIVAATVAPTITHIKDTQGTEIPPDGFTVDTSVTLTGNASAGLEVEIFDGAVSRQKVNANAGGQWTLTINTLSVTRHDMKVRANYGSNPESAVRKFTVTAVVTPTITSVKDPQGNAVSNGGSTYANAVTASGKASIGQSVEVFDGASSKGTASVNTSGDWSRSVSGLSVGAHSLTSKALYANKPVSSPWALNVQAATAPTLSVRDSRGEIGQGGTTTETTVTASGTAVASEQVEVFDKNASKGTTRAGGGGAWSLSVGVALGSHSIKAVGRYADNPSSGTRDFNVVSPIPEFVLDSSAVSLNGGLWGLAGYPGHEPLNWPAATTYRRNPSSGVAPYSYTSSDPSKAIVDSTGFIISVSNGTATITVQDQEGRRGSYTVTVSNVTMVYGMGKRDYKDANRQAAARGLHLMNMDQLRRIYSQYGNKFPMGDMPYWSTNAAGFLQNYNKNMVSGVESTGIITLPGSYCGVIAI